MRFVFLLFQENKIKKSAGNAAGRFGRSKLWIFIYFLCISVCSLRSSSCSWTKTSAGVTGVSTGSVQQARAASRKKARKPSENWKTFSNDHFIVEIDSRLNWERDEIPESQKDIQADEEFRCCDDPCLSFLTVQIAADMAKPYWILEII